MEDLDGEGKKRIKRTEKLSIDEDINTSDSRANGPREEGEGERRCRGQDVSVYDRVVCCEKREGRFFGEKMEKDKCRFALFFLASALWRGDACSTWPAANSLASNVPRIIFVICLKTK